MSTSIKTALITGGNGNLGRLVGAKLEREGVKVIRFDIPSSTDQPSNDPLEVLADIRDQQQLDETISIHQPDTIYHLASLLSGSSEADPQSAWEINASASFTLLNLAQKHQVSRFFFASTIASYGSVEQNTMSQDYPQWPTNLYGVTKIAVERLGVYFKLKHGLDFRCLRFPLVISPFAPTTAVTAYPSHALRAAYLDQPFTFPVSRDVGMSTIFLDDVVDSIIQITQADRLDLTQHAYSLHAFTLTTERVINAIVQRFPNFQYDHDVVDTVEDLIRNWPDSIDDHIAKQDWGWCPAYNFEQSIDRLIQMLKEP